MNPCPPTSDRLKEYNRLTAVPDSRFNGLAIQKELLTLPSEIDKSTVIISPHFVATEDSRLLRSLALVFGDAEPSDELIDMRGCVRRQSRIAATRCVGNVQRLCTLGGQRAKALHEFCTKAAFGVQRLVPERNQNHKMGVMIPTRTPFN